MPVGTLCKKYEISEDTWKEISTSIIQHLLLVNLFPTSEPGADVINTILEQAELDTEDKSGEIYSTVSRLAFIVLE